MKQLSIASVDAYLSKRIKENFFVIYGQEAFFFDIIIKKIENALFPDKTNRELNYQLFYGTENTIAEILAACLAFPMFSDKKMIVVKEFDKLQISDPESFLKYISKPQPTTVLVCVADRYGTNKFQKDVLKNSVNIYCTMLKSHEIYHWVVEQFNQAQIEIKRDSLAFLIENTGSNLLRLNLEIEKLKNFLDSGESLTLEKITQITGFTRDVNIFNFQKFLAKRNLQQSLKIGYYLIEQGEYMAAILPMVFNFFRRMWIVKQLNSKGHSEKSMLGLLGGSAYAYRDIFANHSNFSYYHLESIFEIILDSELQLKTSNKPGESILTILCYIICRETKN